MVTNANFGILLAKSKKKDFLVDTMRGSFLEISLFVYGSPILAKTCPHGKFLFLKMICSHNLIQIMFVKYSMKTSHFYVIIQIYFLNTKCTCRHLCSYLQTRWVIVRPIHILYMKELLVVMLTSRIHDLMSDSCIVGVF